MTKRELIIDIASKDVGVTEQPPGSNRVKYNDWFYNKPVQGKNYAWCFTFVSWVYAMAKCPLRGDYLRGFAGCPYGNKYFKKSGEATKDPQPGDIVLFEFTGDFNDDHVGIFVGWKKKGESFYTIEGNTSFDDKGSQSNGGAVAAKTRLVKNVSIFASPKILCT